MKGIIGVIVIGRCALSIFGGYLARWIFLCDFRDALVYFVRLFLLGLAWVKRYHIHYRGVGVFRCQLPTDLQDGSVYLDAQEIFRLSSNLQCCLEGDDAVDVGHGGFSNVSIAAPCSFPLPSQVVGTFAVVHNGWYAIVVIRRHVIVLSCLCLGFLYFPLFLLPCGKFFVQLFDGSLVLVVLLPILGCIFHTCIGDLLDK